ncbi:hypothetical protein [uncultured phage cr118_1]|uniref:Uncharacterized protein n=1 Tax=uncultured phage cr118_1 TaxID=2772063 RepID=A0A7M1RVU9_9CAUD|nr:hypothetical protein KNV30_gp57 [uncultured phage cr118_1]QOR58416.1 hypothetical protein [uncultured phage cr118_1]
MVHYAALFFVNTDNPSRPFRLDVTKCTTSKTVLDEWLVRYNDYPKVIVLQSTDLTQLWEMIWLAELSVNEDSYGG